MKKLIDVTHTVKASAAPFEGARYMFDPATNERFWVSDAAVPEEVPAPPVVEVELLPLPEQKVIEVRYYPEPEVVKHKGKK